MIRVGLVGYGRFGRALGELLAAAGARLLAHDPQVAVPERFRAASLRALATGSRFVILAVPISQVGSALAAIRPHLLPTHIVLDACSVKLRPSEQMSAVLGQEIPWVATHPLFGPTSLALEERPLHVVVCPNPLHPRAVLEVCSLYRQIGCTVIEENPERHDHSMAYSHALTYFIARALFDIGVTEAVHIAPPSFQALSRTIEAVRSDAGHLVSAVHRENPFSGVARRRLLEALTAIDGKLQEPEPEVSGSEEGLALPDLGPAWHPPLEETRTLIDEVDRELLALLARRANLSRRALLAKAAAGRAVLDTRREAELLEERRRWAGAMGLEPSFIDDLFDAILRYSRSIQQRALAEGGLPSPPDPDQSKATS